MRAAIKERRTKASPTIAKLSSRFEMSNLADGKSESTISWYRDILKLFLRYLKENRHSNSIEEFNIENARNYVLHLRSRSKFGKYANTQVQHTGLSPQTVRGHIRGLKAFSSWLYREGYTDENTLRNLKIPKAPVKLIEPLADWEISKITSSISQGSPTGSRNHAIFITALDNGLRASEIAAITLEQLDLKKGFVKVMGKGSKERIVPIGDYVKMTLWAYINKIRPEPTVAGCDNLFLSTTGEPITTNTIKLVFSKLAKNSGVKRLHAHLCRHTFAINYLLNGGDIFSLREILGHTTLEMVNHYLHFTRSQLTAQHHKYSPMDRLHKEQTAVKENSQMH
ncbi:tyrosine-type recombinase/integrase [Chloroflexota bacterium]